MEGKIRVVVKTFGLIYDLTGEMEFTLSVDKDSSIGDIINIMFERYPGLKDIMLDEDGRIKSYYRILLNGRDVEHIEGMDTHVGDGDVIAFLSPAGG